MRRLYVILAIVVVVVALLAGGVAIATSGSRLDVTPTGSPSSASASLPRG